MASQLKEKQVEELKEDLKGSEYVIVTHYQGLLAEDFDSLRGALRPIGAKYKVVKNRLAKIALDANGFGDIKDQMKGPVAIAYKGTDIASLVKVLFKFGEKNPNFKVSSGFAFGSATDSSSLKAIANLPSREVLIATLMTRLQTPLTNLAATLNEPLRSLHAALSALAKKKDAPAA